MTRSASGAAACLTIALFVLVTSCGRSAPDSPRFQVLDVSGTWDVYRTYAGEPERGPDASTWTNVPDGYGIAMELLCSNTVLPETHVNIAGRWSGNGITLTDGSATWEGTLAGTTMTGTFSDPHGTGTWRAVKVGTARCGTYEVWGGNAPFPDFVNAPYTPEASNYVLLGTATATHTFVGQYTWYDVVTRGKNTVQVDTFEVGSGTYVGTGITGNVVGNPSEIGGAPNGTTCQLGTGEGFSSGGYLFVEPASAPTSLTVHVVE